MQTKVPVGLASPPPYEKFGGGDPDPTLFLPPTNNSGVYLLGTSFTANNCTLVYLVDEAGARTTTDTFHDLFENNIADTLFR